MKKTAYLIFALVLPVIGIAQNAAADFSAMHNAYLNNYLSLDFEVKQYSTESDKTGTVVGTGKIRKSKSDYYSIFDGQEMIIADNKMLNIDHQGKKMSYYQFLSAEKTAKANAAVMDTFLLEQADSVKYNGTNTDGKRYSIYSSGNDAYRIDITIDAATNLVREIVYYYPPATTDNDYGAYKVVIHYSLLSNTKPDAGYFNLKKYILDGKNPQATSTYSNYHFTIIN
ncbi:MAG: hypothetical protein M3R17_11585 [Bacteroidota bacterium]|nr:hypothetical protein [Bacteroidota bacterium]